VDVLVTRRKSYASESDVDRCQFIDISNPEASGGAIRSSAPIRVVNTLFRGCESRFGGAIAVSNSASLQFVTADRCTADESGAFEMRTEEAHGCDFTLSLFLDVSAQYYGAVYRNSWGKFLVASSNFTRPAAAACVGCMEADYGAATMRFSSVCGAAAGQHNGALCVRLSIICGSKAAASTSARTCQRRRCSCTTARGTRSSADAHSSTSI
jgi:hypothetical protein